MSTKADLEADQHAKLARWLRESPRVSEAAAKALLRESLAACDRLLDYYAAGKDFDEALHGPADSPAVPVSERPAQTQAAVKAGIFKAAVRAVRNFFRGN